MFFMHSKWFQSLLDFAVSVVLLLTGLTTPDQRRVHASGLLAQLECRLWNTHTFLWGLFDSSSYNVVSMTVER